MLTTTFSEFRNNAKKYFDAVENDGEVVEIFRHGMPVAILEPARAKTKKRWKKSTPLSLRGVSLSSLILDERKRS